MIDYNLSGIAKPKKRVLLPEIEDRRSTYYAYIGALRNMLKHLNRAVAQELASFLTHHKRELGTDHASDVATVVVQDIDPADFNALNTLGRALARIASASVTRILRLESQVHTKTFIETAKKTLGIDLSAVVREEDLEQYLEAMATRNAELIVGLSDDIILKVKRTMIDAIIRGQSVKDTKKQILETFNAGDSRAQLIARDQTAKLTSDLNRIRHQQAGVQKYLWRTSLDERVRPRHRKLEGNEYVYGEPTGAEDGLPPGQPIQCRCVAQGIVDGV
jgi:SPP1 gp7 family putative phage head morphogenesis protein